MKDKLARLARIARRTLRRRDPDVIVSWNVKVGRKRRNVLRNLAALIDDTHADVIVLQEAQQYLRVIRARFGLRWAVFAAGGWPEAGHNPVMVRRAVRRGRRRQGRRWGVIRMAIGWTGPKHGHRHPGRTWTWVQLAAVLVVSIHRVTGGSGHRLNGAAYAEEADMLVEFVQASRGPVLVFGDMNTQLADDRPDSMRSIARRVGGELIADPDEPGIDYALAVGLGDGWWCRRIGRYDSDHRATVIERK